MILEGEGGSIWLIYNTYSTNLDREVASKQFRPRLDAAVCQSPSNLGDVNNYGKYSIPNFIKFISKFPTTRAGVCKTLCPQLPDSNTVWLQHCLAMTVTTVQIYDFNVILSKGNNSKIGDDWNKKKIRITFFSWGIKTWNFKTLAYMVLNLCYTQ